MTRIPPPSRDDFEEALRPVFDEVSSGPGGVGTGPMSILKHSPEMSRIRWAAHEIKTRLKHSLLYHIIEITPWSRIPERRYALIDYDP